MKTLGIIGGLGPATTAHFYLEVVFGCSKILGQRPQILISNVAIPLSIEQELITEAKNAKGILPFLLASAKQLEDGGADVIVIPCNTVHTFISEIRASTNVPVLSIIEETAKFLEKENVKEIGILSTKATIKNKLFHKELHQRGIRIKIPDHANQQTIGGIIHRLVCDEHTKEDRSIFTDILQELNVDTALLACTDLQLLHPKVKGVKIFDTLQIFTQTAIRTMV
jgi:aspartate racemase